MYACSTTVDVLQILCLLESVFDEINCGIEWQSFMCCNIDSTNPQNDIVIIEGRSSNFELNSRRQILAKFPMMMSSVK